MFSVIWLDYDTKGLIDLTFDTKYRRWATDFQSEPKEHNQEKRYRAREITKQAECMLYMQEAWVKYPASQGHLNTIGSKPQPQSRGVSKNR